MNHAVQGKWRRVTLGGVAACLFVFGCGGAQEQREPSGTAGDSSTAAGGNASGGKGNGGGTTAKSSTSPKGGTSAGTKQNRTTTGGRSTVGTGSIGGDYSTDAKVVCDTLVAKYTECSLITAGAVVVCPTTVNVYESCVTTCMTSRGCSAVRSFACDGALSATLVSCRTECESLDKFQCTSGGTVPLNYQCDGDDDCDDSSDELGCPVFTCTSGAAIPPEYRCDGSGDCADGSDEVSCPVFTCTSGATIPPEYRCDGDNDCADSSDEAGCAKLICLQ